MPFPKSDQLYNPPDTGILDTAPLRTEEYAKLAHEYFTVRETLYVDQAHDLMNDFARQYRGFADAVLADVARLTPEEVNTAKLFYQSACEELDRVREDLKVRTSEDVGRLGGLIRGVMAYAYTTQLIEDKETMLLYAIEELKSSAQSLGLLTRLSSPNSQNWRNLTIDALYDDAAKARELAALAAHSSILETGNAQEYHTPQHTSHETGVRGLAAA